MQGDVPDEGADPGQQFLVCAWRRNRQMKGHIPGLQGWIEKGRLGPGG